MKRILILLFIGVHEYMCAQVENLVPNGDFESRPFPQMLIGDENPSIPCAKGEINSGSSHAPEGWTGFGFINYSNRSTAPDLFDSRFDCNSIPWYCASLISPCQGGYGGDIVGIPNNYYGYQEHRTQIGGNTIGRYAGLKTAWPTGNGGIYTKLKRPLKCGYTLTRNAAQPI